MVEKIYYNLGENSIMKHLKNRELEDIRGYSKKHNEHVVSYIMFIMGELVERMTVKEVFNIIDYQGLEGLRYAYNKI